MKKKKRISLEKKENLYESEKEENRKEFDNLYIVKLIYSIKESKYKIFKNLEKLFNEEDFERIMLNLIDNFRKLDEFYNTNKINNHSEFKRTVYKDFMEIFSDKYEIDILKSNKRIKISFWQATDIIKEIHKYL